MLLITNLTIVTMDARRRILSEGAIVLEGERILAVGKATELEARFAGAQQFDGRGMLALPGFIDAHVHSDQALLRSIADDQPWRPFLNQFIWPIMAKRSPEDALLSLKLCMLEMIKAGTTCFVDSIIPSRYPFDALAQTVADMGMRAVLTKYVMPQASFSKQGSQVDTGDIASEEGSFADAEQSIRAWHGAAGGRLQVWYGPLVPREPAATCPPEFYLRVSRQAKEHGVGITIHLGGEKDDPPFFERVFNVRPVEFARQNGLVGPNVLLINGCWFDQAEIRILADTDTRIVHSPSANMKMASGIADIPLMRAAGVTVALGCDSGANNNCHDMIREMKAASLLHKISSMDARTLPAEAVLEMATIEGARALGREDQIGSLEAGKQADLILVDLRQAHTMPVYDPIANLVYAAHGGNVDTVIVAGRVLMRNRLLLHVDEAAVLSQAQETGQKLLASAGIKVAPTWPIE